MIPSIEPARWIADRIEQLDRDSSGRLILGIAGPPGAGKSTVSGRVRELLSQTLLDRTVVVPMDGYHFEDDYLRDIGLHHLKGVPETFDAEGFVNLIARLRDSSDEPTRFPVFDRSVESSIADAGLVAPEHTIVLVEGNYLLLEREPWHRLRYYFDEVYYLDVPPDILRERLIARHMEGGRDRPGAESKVESTDMPNAVLVAGSAHLSQKILENS
ncbi:MAG: AAA family ATPase [Candidatus Obscuribacterales bacterium]